MFFVGAMFGKLFEGDSGSHLGFNRFFGFVLITGETRTNIELTHGEFNIMIMYFAFCTSQIVDICCCFRIIRKLLQKMAGSTITLTNDPNMIAQLNSERVLVAVPLLYAFMTHYLFQALRLIKSENEKAERLNDHGKRLFLYGVAALFSMNFLQSSIMTTIMAWATLICVIVNHCFVFLKQTGQKYHNNGLLAYYGLLMVWFISIIFFYIYNANNSATEEN